MSNPQHDQDIGRRLHQARKDAGISLQDAAGRVGFENYQVLSNIEKGTRPVRVWELVRIARAYGRTATEFLEPERPLPELVLLWRQRTRQARNRHYTAIIGHWLQEYNDLEGLAGFARPAFSPPSVTRRPQNYDEVRELGARYARQLGLGIRPAQILAQVLEQSQGVRILYLDLEECGSAVSTRNEAGAVIAVNRSNAPWRRNFDIAHELFHLVTWNLYKPEEVHPDSNEKSQVEKYADTFASALLLPAEALRTEAAHRIRNNALSYLDLVALARDFAVSTDALLIGLRQVGLISQRNLDHARRSRPYKDLDRDERRCDKDAHPPVSRRLLELAYRGMQLGMVSRGKFCEYVGIPRGEIGHFLRNQGLEEDVGVKGAIPTA